MAWLLIQIATQVFPFFDIPNWEVRLVRVIAAGFPIALVIAWAFELTTGGIKRTWLADDAQSHRESIRNSLTCPTSPTRASAVLISR